MMKTTIEMTKFKGLLSKIEKLGFDEMYQAGSPSQYHELNLILQDNEKDLQIWVCKSFGKFHVSYRNSIKNIDLKHHRIPCASQKEVIEKVIYIRENLCRCVQSQTV